MGGTKVVAGVYGPGDLYPRFLQKSGKALLRCYYDMMSFSVTDRKRPGPGRRETELGLVIKNALEPFLLLENFPKAGIKLFMEIYQADAGTRCASINAASLALADAGIPMRDLVSSVAAGTAGDAVILDLNKKEEDHKDGATDIPIAMSVRTGDISLFQLDGAISKKDLQKAMEFAKKGCKEVYDLQKKALAEKYGVD